MQDAYDVVSSAGARKASHIIHRHPSLADKIQSNSSTIPVDLKITQVHSGLCNALWQYYCQNSYYVSSRDKLEDKALQLARRIHSSISIQSKTMGFNLIDQIPFACQFTCIKAYAEALVADYLSFMQHLSVLRNLECNTNGLSAPESLFYDNFQAKCFNERSSRSPSAGEISFELQSPSDSDTLEEECVTTALHITYALWCAVDSGYIIGTLDVLEHYYSDSMHPL